MYYDDNGGVEDIHKSEYTMTDEDVEAAHALWNQLAQNETAYALARSGEGTSTENYRFSYINGELRLVEERTVATHSDTCCTQTALYDVLTGEVLVA